MAFVPFHDEGRETDLIRCIGRDGDWNDEGSAGMCGGREKSQAAEEREGDAGREVPHCAASGK